MAEPNAPVVEETAPAVDSGLTIHERLDNLVARLEALESGHKENVVPSENAVEVPEVEYDEDGNKV